MYISSYYKKIG